VNWKQFGNGLPNVVSYDMRLTPENRLVVGTFGRGIWSTDAVTAIETPAAQPSTLTLQANYPNPFGAGIADATTLRFSLQSQADITLQVFDATGRLVRTLASGRHNAGSHTASFTAAQLPAGTYFAVLKTGAQSVTRKMVLLR
jgi:hypothetical protein